MENLVFSPDVLEDNSSFRDEVTLINIIFRGWMRHSCIKDNSHFFFLVQQFLLLTSRSYSFPSGIRLQPIAKRLTLPDSEINRTHQNPVLGFVVLGLISQ